MTQASATGRLRHWLQRAMSAPRWWRAPQPVTSTPATPPAAPAETPAEPTAPGTAPGFQSAYVAFMATEARLVFPASADPEISVLVAAPHDPALLFACLQALLAQTGCRYEVVLADAPAALLGRVVNLAGEPAGRALLLLDGAALLRPGALAAAWNALPAGAVAGRIVLPSGLVHSAGGVLWRDGTTAAYGAGVPDGTGEIMFPREVDHGSHRLLLLDRSAPHRLADNQRLDEAASGDAVLGEALRAAGLRTVYEPLFAADLIRSAADPAPTRQQQRTLRIATAASSRCRLPPHPHNLLFARDSAQRPRLLVIDGFVPLPIMGAGYPRARAIVNAADALGWAVTIYPLDSGDAGWEAIYGSVARGIEVCNRRGAAHLASFLAERAGFYEVVLVSRPEYMVVLRDILHAAPTPMLGGVRLIYDAEALFSSRTLLRRQLDGDPPTPAEQAALVAEEMALTAGVDAVLAVTAAEAAIFADGQPAPVTVLSHPVEPRLDAPGVAGRAGFLFVGRVLEQQSPNYDGLAWFIREVWPGIRRALPAAELIVAGALHADPAELRAPGVRLLGPVADLRPVYDSARVFVAPVRYAAGLPIKALEAAEAGLPVVTTTLAARQLGWRAGEEVAAADDPGVLAAAAVALHEDDELWARMRAAAAARLVAEHSRERFRATLQAVLAG